MSKRISKVGNIKYALSGNDDFVASVDPGETSPLKPLRARSRGGANDR